MTLREYVQLFKDIRAFLADAHVHKLRDQLDALDRGSK